MAEASAFLSFDLGMGPGSGRACLLGQRGDALLPSLAMVDKAVDCGRRALEGATVVRGRTRATAVEVLAGCRR